MQFAVDKDDKRVWIENTHSNQAYFCPYCGTELIVKRQIKIRAGSRL